MLSFTYNCGELLPLCHIPQLSQATASCICVYLHIPLLHIHPYSLAYDIFRIASFLLLVLSLHASLPSSIHAPFSSHLLFASFCASYKLLSPRLPFPLLYSRPSPPSPPISLAFYSCIFTLFTFFLIFSLSFISTFCCLLSCLRIFPFLSQDLAVFVQFLSLFCFT